MKLRLKFFLGLFLSTYAMAPLFGQQQAVVSVDVTSIQVGSGPIRIPPNEVSGAALTPITIRANAVGTTLVSSFTYSFFVNGLQIGTTAAVVPPPFAAAVTWTPPQPGAYFITVTATDGVNTATSLPVRYFATGTQLISPLTGTLVPNGSSLVIKGDATPAGGFIQRLDFYADGVLIGTDTSAPYSLIYTPATTPTTHTIEIRAFDNNGLQVSPNGTSTATITMVTPIGVLPTSVIASPLNGSPLAIPNYVANPAASIPVTVSANDTDGTLGKVELYIDGVLSNTSNSFPYTFAWKPQVIGTYRLVALAYDDKNNVTASAPSIITISAPPLVSLTAPAPGATVNAGSPTQVTANASDSDGSIASVQFFADGVLIAEKTSSPYAVAWTPSVKALFAPTILTALATDNVGVTTVSTSVSVTVVGPGGGSGGAVIGVPPTVSVTAPAAGSSLGVASPVNISAIASDPDGNIKTVQFLANGDSLGVDSAFPYSVSWTPTNLGTFAIVARATDNDGNVITSSVVSVTVIDPSPGVPAVSVTAPSAGSVLPVGTTQTITASASASTAITTVQFLVNGQPIGSSARFPYSAAWTPSSPGAYIITARASDDVGKQTTSAPVNVTVTGGLSPVIALTGPAAGSVIALGSGAQITANASDPDGSVTQVRFFANGVLLPSGTLSLPPYSLTWVPASAGAFQLTAVATDNTGNTTTSAAVAVTVTSTGAPAVAITNPGTGLSFGVGTSVPINATVTGGNGPITQVQFFINGIALSSDAAAPYTATWSPGAAGTYNLMAVATDSAGISTASSAVAVTIASNNPPTVSLVSPGTNLVVGLGTSVNLSATASDRDGTISNVRFLINGTLLATRSGLPYSTAFTPTAPGVYSIVAQATDNSGNVTDSAPQTITILGGNVPLVTLGSPTADVSISADSSLLLSADAAISAGTIDRVEFYAGNALLATRTTEPYLFVWRPALIGVYSVRAVAYDGTGTSVSSSVSTVTVGAPQAGPGILNVKITNPTNGSSIVAFRNLTLSAVDNLGNFPSPVVDYYIDGFLFQTVSTAPYSYTFNFTTPGVFQFHAVARLPGSIYTSDPVNLTVLPNNPPVVALTAPSTGSTLTVGSSVTIKATATDADDLIDSVRFLVNGQVLSTDTAFPYEANWTPTSEGIYTLTAIAKDSQGSVGGNQTTSAQVFVRVTAPAASGGSGVVPDSVYAGSFQSIGETGKYALITLAGKSATFIGYTTAGGVKTLFYPSLSLDATGGFSSGTALSARVNSTGVSGSLDANRLPFIGQVAFAGATRVASGLFTGNLANRNASTVAAIVGPDGSIMVYVADGAFSDAGAGAVDASGNFNLLLAGGSRLAGKADPATGFLNATLTGGPGGLAIGALASGGSFSDGTLRSLSTRGQVGTGANFLIAGFVVGGSAQKQVMVRAIAPTLGTVFGLPGALADSQLEIFNSSGSRIITNDNWATSTNASAIVSAAATVGAFPLTSGSLDSVILTTLAPGAYTAQVSGIGGRTGVALVELYDVDSVGPFSPQKVTSVSTRGVVGTGENNLIAGFQVSGSTSKLVLVRGIGPGLDALNVAGALADPLLQIIRMDRGTRTVVRENDNWETGNDVTLVTDASTKVGAFPLRGGSRDAVILISLPPGTYSATVGGVGSTTGVGLVEVYEVP